MERKLIFTGKTGRWDVPSFVWTENENLRIVFDTQETRVGRYYASIRCGKRLMEVSLGNAMTAEVGAEFIKNGEYEPLQVSLEFRALSGSGVIVPSDPKRGGYFVEPLRIERVEESATAVAWLQELEEKISAINARVDTIDEKVNDCKLEIASVPAQIKAATDEMGLHLVNGDPLKL